MKFNMLLDFCIGQAAVSIKEFYILPVGEKLMKYDNRDYCIALVPFEARNDYYEKFYWANGPYIGEMPHEQPEMNYETLEDITIPKNVKIMFHFYIIYPKKETK